VKLKKAKPKERFLHFLFIEHRGKTYIKQRTNEKVWHNLFEPPFIEYTKEVTSQELLSLAEAKLLLGPFESVEGVFNVKHQLTHLTIFASFWKVKVGSHFKLKDKAYIAVALKDLPNYPIHRLFDKFLQFKEQNPRW
jgi:adenine-specific DNA glycosylase